MSRRMVAPVVVIPEVLSNQAFASENSPPQRRYGSIPKRQQKNHERMSVASPSRKLMSLRFLTNTTGNIPARRVTHPLSSSGENAVSKS